MLLLLLLLPAMALGQCIDTITTVLHPAPGPGDWTQIISEYQTTCPSTSFTTVDWKLAFGGGGYQYGICSCGLYNCWHRTERAGIDFPNPLPNSGFTLVNARLKLVYSDTGSFAPPISETSAIRFDSWTANNKVILPDTTRDIDVDVTSLISSYLWSSEFKFRIRNESESFLNWWAAYYGTEHDSLLWPTLTLKWYHNTSPQVPDTMWSYNVQDTSAIIKWFPQPNSSGYQLQYKVAGTSNWMSAWKYNNIGHKALPGLAPSTTYKYRIRTLCASGAPSPWSAMGTFKTLSAPCEQPAGLLTSPVGYAQVRLNWSAVAGAVSYRIRYRPQGGSWTVLPKGGAATHHWLTGLSTGTTYDWQMRTLCQFGNVTGTPWTTMNSFTTSGTPKTQLIGGGAVDGQPLELRVIPNPNRGAFRLVVDGLGGETATTVTISDVLGRRVWQQTLSVQSQQSLDIELPAGTMPGTYLLQLEHGQLRSTQRIVVQ